MAERPNIEGWIPVCECDDNGTARSQREQVRRGTGLVSPVLTRVVVVGCSGHARVVIDILETENRCRIVGLLDTFKPVTSKVLGYQVLGNDDDLPSLIAAGACDGVFVAVGDNWVRSQVVNRIRELVPGIRFVTAIHPSAQISGDVSIGAGTVVMPGVIVNAGCHIGECCILNTGSSLDHDSTMERFSSLAPRAVTGGTVTIGAFSAIAIGAVISHAVRIGEHTVIGAGATVVRDIPDGVVAYGTPARIVRKRKPGDPYLGERSYEIPSFGNFRQSPAIIGSLKTPRLIPSKSAEWNVYLERTPHDFFHRAEFHQVSEDVGGGKAWLSVYGSADKFVAWPVMMQDIEGRGSACGRHLKDISSVYGYAGPTVHGCEQDQGFLSSAWNGVREMWRSAGVVSVFTRFHPLLANQRFVPNLRNDRIQPDFAHDEFAEGATVAIDLSRSAEETWGSYKRSLRQALPRLSNLGITVQPDPEWVHLDDFFRMYHTTMKRNNARPFYFFPREYLQKLQRALGPHGTLLIARSGDQIAGSALLMEYGGIVNVHLLASDDNFLRLSPSKLIIHEAQLWARARGNRLLHLGGGRGSKTDDSLFRFKRLFSDRSFPFYTGRWILDRETYDVLSSERGEASRGEAGGDTAESFFPTYREPF